MREPKRIQELMDTIVLYWEKYYPDLRFFQMMKRLEECVKDKTETFLYFIEDEELKSIIEKLIEETKKE